MVRYVTQKKFMSDEILIVRIDDNGTPWWMGDGEQNADYQAWLAEGNTPEPWEAE